LTIAIDKSSFPNAWGAIVQHIMDHGHNRPADDERAVMIRNVEAAIDLDYSAISDIYHHRLHPLYPQHDGLDEYIAQFDPGTVQAKQSMMEQPYTYMGRTIRQMQVMRSQHLVKRPFNKRNIAITWNPFEDLGAPHPACLQNIQLVNIGEDRVHMFTHWRSHDAYAWQWNIIALVEYVTREVLKPEGLKLVKYTEFNNSLHIYDYNWMDAKHVRPLAEVALHMMY